MKRSIILSVAVLFLSLSSYGKKDINAWKKEKNLEEQYKVFKENLNFWNGNYFLNDKQLNEFHNVLMDSVAVLENEIATKTNTINSLQNELNAASQQLENTKAELETSIKNQNAISVFGQHIDKSVYTLIMSVLIVALLTVLGVVFLLYRRSHSVTARTKKYYDELRQEFEAHKKNALERYTKINMELQHTRLKLNKN